MLEGSARHVFIHGHSPSETGHDSLPVTLLEIRKLLRSHKIASRHFGSRIALLSM